MPRARRISDRPCAVVRLMNVRCNAAGRAIPRERLSISAPALAASGGALFGALAYPGAMGRRPGAGRSRPAQSQISTSSSHRNRGASISVLSAPDTPNASKAASTAAAPGWPCLATVAAAQSRVAMAGTRMGSVRKGRGGLWSLAGQVRLIMIPASKSDKGAGAAAAAARSTAPRCG